MPADQDERHRRRRHVHFRAHRADLGDEIDEPVDLFLRLAEIGAFDRPARARAGSPARDRLRGHAPQLLGHERHERVEEFQDLVAHMRCRGARLGSRRLVSARRIGFTSSTYQSADFQTKW